MATHFSIIWSRGEPITAVVVVALCILLNYLISKIRAGMGKRLHDQGAWLSFMLFLGIIGGILAYGPQGFCNRSYGGRSSLWISPLSRRAIRRYQQKLKVKFWNVTEKGVSQEFCKTIEAIQSFLDNFVRSGITETDIAIRTEGMPGHHRNFFFFQKLS